MRGLQEKIDDEIMHIKIEPILFRTNQNSSNHFLLSYTTSQVKNLYHKSDRLKHMERSETKLAQLVQVSLDLQVYLESPWLFLR